MTTLWLDLETFCMDADLPEVGVHHYAELDSFPILFAYAYDDEPAQVWQCEREPMPDGLGAALDEAYELVAHNAAFDRTILEHHRLVVPNLDRWTCTMAMALSLSLPAGLGQLCRALRVPEDEAKLAKGNRLVHKFCKPRRPSKKDSRTRWTWENAPEDWELFVTYARMDVEAMRACYRKMPGYNFERRVWNMDQRMNDRGFAVDRQLCTAAWAVAEQEQKRLEERMIWATDAAVTKTTQVSRIKAWAASQGVELDSLARDTLEGVLRRPGLPEGVRDVLTARLEASRATAAKYTTLFDGTSFDGRARGCFQYAGAGQTMRWAGRRFQPQNLFRPVVDCHQSVEALLAARGSPYVVEMLWGPTPTLDVVASAVRGALVAPEGRSLSVWDLSQIEARITFWYARSERMLEAFADPERDPYLETAQGIGAGQHRQLGKALVLACGFGMGGTVFAQTAAKAPYNIDMSEEQGTEYVYDWRSANPEVPTLWKDVERLSKHAIVKETRMRHKPTGLIFAWEVLAGDRGCLTIQLPSGHRLVYWDAEFHEDDRGGHITYTRFGDGMIPGYHIWGGGFVENVVQATARHIMAGALLRTEEFADVVGTVHDEGIAECDDEDLDEVHRKMGEAFERVPKWGTLPENGPTLPLAAEGYTTKRYRK